MEKSQMDIASQRLLDAINNLGVAQMGSLWIVGDDVWEEVIDGFVRKRKGHPGLSKGKEGKYMEICEQVSMLIGSSRKRYRKQVVFAVKNVIGEEDSVTYFSGFRPKIVPPGMEHPLAVRKFALEVESIKRNSKKAILDAQEMQEFKSFLDRNTFVG